MQGGALMYSVRTYCIVQLRNSTYLEMHAIDGALGQCDNTNPKGKSLHSMYSRMGTQRLEEYKIRWPEGVNRYSIYSYTD